MTIKKAKILIADDNPELNLIITRYLKKMPYKLVFTMDGYSTYKELNSNSYDLCLLDINMPGKSGLEILQEIKEKNIYTSIIMITGNCSIKNIIQVMRLGADDYIQKPFELDELGISIKKTMENHNIRMENIKYKTFLEKEVNKKTHEIKSAYLDIVTTVVNAMETKDNYTGHHVKRVSQFCILIGKELGFNAKKIEEIKIGGILHDIGKIGIPDLILNKPGPLTREEFEKIKMHPQLGYEIIKNAQSLKSIYAYVLYHHERYNGKGYPEGLQGENIPIEGRILALADAFDAMTTDRPYRKALTLKQAYKEIVENSGTDFDPNIVNIFKKLWNKNSFQDIFLRKAEIQHTSQEVHHVQHISC